MKFLIYCGYILNDVAPDNTYFSGHEGDSSDYGFWDYHEETEDYQ